MPFGAPVQSKKGTSTTAITTASFDGATTAGNLIVLAFASDDYNGTPDAGWTQSAEMEQQTFHGGYLWWRISAGETSFQYTIGSATVSAWVLAEFSGNHASPFDISEGTFIQSAATTIPTPGIIPTAGQRLLVAMVGGSHSITDISGVYDAWNNSFTAIQSGGTTGGATDDCVGLAYRIVTGDGSTSFTTTGDFNAAASPQSRSALIIAFKEGATAYDSSAFQLNAFQSDAFQTGGVAATVNVWQAAATLNGAGSLSARPALIEVAAATLNGAGSLSANAKRSDQIGAATLNGTGNLSANATRSNQIGAATLAGAGNVSAYAVLIEVGAARFNGSSTLAALSTSISAGSATLAGAGNLAADADLIEQASARFAGTGIVSANSSLALPSSAIFGGAGTLSVNANLIEQAATRLEGAGSLAANANLIEQAAARLEGASTLQIEAIVAGSIPQIQGRFNGAGDLSVGTIAWCAALARLNGTGTLSGLAISQMAIAARLAGAGAVSANSSVYKFGAATLAGAGGLSTLGNVRGVVTGRLEGAGGCSALANLIERAGAILAGSGSLSAFATVAGAVTAWAGQATLNGTGSLTVQTIQGFAGRARLNGTGGLSAQAIRQWDSSPATLAGAGALSASARVVHQAAAILAADSTLTVTALGQTRLIAARLAAESSLSVETDVTSKSSIQPAPMAGEGGLRCNVIHISIARDRARMLRGEPGHYVASGSSGQITAPGSPIRAARTGPRTSFSQSKVEHAARAVPRHGQRKQSGGSF